MCLPASKHCFNQHSVTASGRGDQCNEHPHPGLGLGSFGWNALCFSLYNEEHISVDLTEGLSS